MFSSHMITIFFERQTRLAVEESLFNSIVGVAAYVGWRSLVMLRLLLEQVTS